MQNQLFQKLLPININFVTGESPSALKLTGIFNYIQASYFILESYLGNGIDYGVQSLSERKMMFNIASTIGATGNIYKPLNKLTSISSIHKNFGALHTNEGNEVLFGDTLHIQHTEHVVGDGVLGEYLSILDELNIPVAQEDNFGNGHQFGIIYKGSGTIKIFNGDGLYTEVTCTAPAQNEYVQKTIPLSDAYVDFINIVPSVDFKIYSIWLTDNTDGLLSNDGFAANNGEEFIYNVACSIPVDNGLESNESFWKIAPPCIHSLPETVDKCDLRTCSKCIGNTYDIFVDQTSVGSPWTPVGQPICGGDVGLGQASNIQGEINASLVPAGGKKYTPVVYNEQSVNVIYTLQSCLLMKSKPYMIKFRPFACHEKLNAEITLPKNGSVLYDMNASYNPIKYNITLRSAGRPDIIYVHDVQKELIANSYNKINIIGGSYSLSSMLYDILKALGEKQSPQVSVYAD